jgi:DNA polymerase epsilon subunit 1
MVIDAQHPKGRAAVDLYFVEDDGGSFKTTILFEPYLYVICKVNHITVYSLFLTL